MDEFFFRIPKLLYRRKMSRPLKCGMWRPQWLSSTVGIFGQRESNVRKRAPPYKMGKNFGHTGWMDTISHFTTCRTSVCSSRKTSSLTTRWIDSRINQRLIRFQFWTKTVAAFVRRHHRFPDSFGQLCSPHWMMNDSSRQFIGINDEVWNFRPKIQGSNLVLSNKHDCHVFLLSQKVGCVVQCLVVSYYSRTFLYHTA